ncbi:MGMT family protein [Paenibacillus sp. CN-4]|uniref:MGMT family protein n=1 Tax=Paenibacillus nanchangensis TaxID=3348343 RepID=UPI00397B7EAA
MTPFTEQVIAIIRSIPEGKVMTYGQIARCAGSPRAARQVVRILHSMSRSQRLPWHRVVSAKGTISIADEESHLLQRMYLEGEGVEFGLHGVIDLNIYRYEPELPMETATEVETATEES